MKRILFSTLMMVVIIMITTCFQGSVWAQEKQETTTTRTVEPSFFYRVTETVKLGDNLWNKSIVEFGNGYSWTQWVDCNPILQQPGRTWQDPIDGRWYAFIFPEEKLVSPVLMGVHPVFQETTTIPSVDSETIKIPWLGGYLLLIVLFALLLRAIYCYFKLRKSCKQKQEISQSNVEVLESTKNRLEKELEEAESKIPIEAPSIVCEEWLQDNNPAGGELWRNDFFRHNMDKVSAKLWGKKPHLIAEALVSTKGKAITMGFSHDRTAITGLEKVPIFLGWNWNRRKKEWIEVGMIAGPCSNKFEMNPDEVQKMDKLFTELDLVTDADHPVIHSDSTVPKGVNYPEMLASLVLKYHKENIKDVTKAGATIKIPPRKK